MPDVTPPILQLLAVGKRFGHTVTADDLTLTVNRGEFFTFLGPSGSGKSTILRMVAGLERPDTGDIRIDGNSVSAIPPWRRNLGMMFQQYATFPHMTVAENVAYGLKVRGANRGQIRHRVAEMLDLVGLSGMAGKNVTLLSGGEQQRVALARALAPEPRMLLLDEPLSALDEKIRRAMQAELKDIHARTGTTFLYVTHDQEEALTMSSRIAVFNRGVCVQCDTPERLWRRPRTRFVAGFFRNCNVLTARCLHVGDDGMRVCVAGTDLTLPLAPGGVRPQEGAELHLAVRAENVHLEAPADVHGARLSVRLAATTFRGTVFDHTLLLADGQRIAAATTRRTAIPIDGSAIALIEPGDLLVLDD